MLQSRTIMLLAWSLIVGISATPSRNNERPVVDVPGKGTVIGIEENVSNFTYFAFRGIPYAEPPVGKLRFKDPIESSGWQGDLDGSKLPAMCSQKFFSISGEEDCLFLSVYTPKDALDSAKDPLAVMVFIHGGYLLMGSMMDSDGCDPLIRKNVIMVNLQYRLGVLGFLSTEDSTAPGNMGLKDQTLALKWVKENIAAFGGDPERITIFGESAGSYSVNYQVLTPSSAGLFHGAIMQSGVSLCPIARGRNFLQVAQDIAKVNGCPEYPSEDLIACLQDQPVDNLLDMTDRFYEWNDHPHVFGPRVDGSYIPDAPLSLLKEKSYNHVPLIIGVNRDEGALDSGQWYAYPPLIESLVGDFDKNGPISMDLLPEEDPIVTAHALFEHYLPGLVIGEEQADNATKLTGHRVFHIPCDWTIELMSPEVSLYMYELHHRGEHGLMDYYHTFGLDIPQAANWVSHGDDLQYFFQNGLTMEHEDDLTVKEIFTNTWTNFAKTLDPTPNETLGYKWEKVGDTGIQFFKILPSPVMDQDYRSTDREFWNTLPLRENPYREYRP